MRPRIKEVAARAGVSTATASVVLNDVLGSRVAASTRERVKTAARELGYAPNTLARGLRIQRTHTIGMLSDRVVTTPYANRMIVGAQRAAWEAGYMLILVSVDESPEMEKEAIRTLGDRQVDGLIYATMYHRILTAPATSGASPTVVLDAEVEDRSAPFVVPDEELGGYDAAALLTSRGHRRIAYLANAHDVPANGLRRAGYERALSDSGLALDPSMVVAAEASSRGGDQAATTLLTRPDRPTAIFAFNDQMATGVYRAARRLGIVIPDDLSVVGYDDQKLVAEELDPGLTTIALPHEAMGIWAAKQLISMIEDPERPTAGAPPIARLEACPVIERGSVAAPPKVLR